jgi:hypothetical protein
MGSTDSDRPDVPIKENILVMKKAMEYLNG